MLLSYNRLSTMVNRWNIQMPVTRHNLVLLVHGSGSTTKSREGRNLTDG